jgi:hypothetical protein
LVGEYRAAAVEDDEVAFNDARTEAHFAAGAKEFGLDGFAGKHRTAEADGQ